MPKVITLEIPVIVGSNGKWCSNGFPSAVKDPDWGLMADSLQDDDGKFPAVERRYLVMAAVEVPDDAPETVVGSVMDLPKSAE